MPCAGAGACPPPPPSPQEVRRTAEACIAPVPPLQGLIHGSQGKWDSSRRRYSGVKVSECRWESSRVAPFRLIGVSAYLAGSRTCMGMARCSEYLIPNTDSSPHPSQNLGLWYWSGGPFPHRVGDAYTRVLANSRLEKKGSSASFCPLLSPAWFPV